MKRIGILIFDGVEELEFIGPLQVFGTASAVGALCSLSTISDHSPVVCRLGTRVSVSDQVQNAEPYDILIVPGGPGAEAASRNAMLLRYLRLPHGLVAPVCDGSTIVAAAGLPIPHGAAGASTSGIDVALQLVERFWGAPIANAVANRVQRAPLPRREPTSRAIGLY